MDREKSFLYGIVGFALAIIFICCACFGLSFLFVGSLSSIGSTDFSSLESGSLATTNTPNQVLVVEVKGIILTEEQGPAGLFAAGQTTYGYEIKSILEEAADNENVKAIVLDINSPGGTVTGSNAIAEGVEYVQNTTDKPVIGFGTGLLASGAYWAALPADEIIVDAGSTIGSIGVVSGQLTYYNQVIAEGEFLGSTVETENGIEKFYISAGEGKDLGNPYRRPTQKELDLLQSQADRVYTDFVDLVVSNRDEITDQELRDEIGAYVYDTSSAIDLGLADRQGTRDDAIESAASAAGLENYNIRTVPDIELDFFSQLFAMSNRVISGQTTSQPGCVMATQHVIAFYGNIAEVCN